MMAHIQSIGSGEQDAAQPGAAPMVAPSASSKRSTRSAGSSTPLTLRDEWDILQSQAALFAKAAGVVARWGYLSTGEVAIYFTGGRLCHHCDMPYFGDVCWECGK